MTHEYQNISNRLVTFKRNTGEACHMAPGNKVKLADFETVGNKMVEKLVKLGVLAMAEPKKKSAVGEEKKSEQNRQRKTSVEGISSSRSKTRSTEEASAAKKRE